MSAHRIGEMAMALVIGGLILGAAGPGRSQSGVSVQLFQFRPGQLEVKAGTRLAFTNQDDIAHTVTSGTPEQPDGHFDVRLEGKGAAASVDLGAPGVYPYFCRRHQSMRGEIRVK
jgi:plastocyanin